MGIQKSRNRNTTRSRRHSLWQLLSDMEDASEAGKHPRRPIAHHFRVSRSVIPRPLPGVRVASDMVAPPMKPQELLDFKPASWELPDSPE